MKVFKYELQNVRDKHQVVMMPEFAQILRISGIGSHIYLWAKVVPENKLTEYRFYPASTGEELPDDIGGYLASIIQDAGQRVLHIFYSRS